ncbi:rhamnogalacturonan acetylesterase [Pseudalgibacter alginicilyticus]|uniref:Rhamnogalacturonan acetylesterase n=1 Tax=Pseudalgibacter alginicilyticus TaxID=1736674 RepID=A0A0P0D4Q4_9FLAO|nr:rhamnogalacturonan acetylesterase [Pseudalgibacter alginicilyticus]ALJ05941.1 rhamnogalacturonan acetylesterase [Pseudalgibacter alginicilyticus]
MNRLIKINVVLLLLFVVANGMAQQTTIYTIGDSTMSNKANPENNPEFGWGQVLQPYFKDGIVIDNRAVNGRSSKSFIDEGRWESVLETLKKGDYVLIQFGHNDQKNQSPERYTNAHVGYRHNLIKYVEETRSKGAIPILLSSIVRRNFNENGVLIDTHGDYPLVLRLVALEYNVPFIDLQYLSENLEKSYGVIGSKKLHLHFEPGENPYYPEGKVDNTHLSFLGATEIAKLAVNEMKIKVPNFLEIVK